VRLILAEHRGGLCPFYNSFLRTTEKGLVFQAPIVSGDCQ
jgi:hypothetical protein